MEKLLKPKEACNILGISYITLRRWIKTGKIAYVKLPSGQTRIPKSEIDKILEKRSKNQKQDA